MVSAVRGMLEALEPPDAVLKRARAWEDIRMAGSRRNSGPEKTARVTGPGGTVIIPLRLVDTRTGQMEAVVEMVRLATGRAPEEGRR